MKKIFLVLVFTGFCTNSSFSQSGTDNLNDAGRIALIPVFNHPIENMPNAAISLVSNKLNQIIVNNGISGNSIGGKFIITSNINVLTKDITPTTPPMHAYTLDVTFFIGDGIEGNLFSQTSITVKGVGETEAKAYISALKNINSKDNRFKEFIEVGKSKIVQYYESKCDFFITEAKNFENQNKFDLALIKLVSVPEVCAACYEKVAAIIPTVYQKKIDYDCKILLSEAHNEWAASQNLDGAVSAGNNLIEISPNSTCYEDAKVLTGTIAKRIKELDNREWEFTLREQKIEADLNKIAIMAARDIGVAQAQNQPTTIVYNNFDHWFY
jgi:5'-3' exonuclease